MYLLNLNLNLLKKIKSKSILKSRKRTNRELDGFILNLKNIL